MQIASAATLAQFLPYPVYEKGGRYRTVAVCHGGVKRDHLLFNDPDKPGASLSVTCFSGGCDRDDIRHALQALTRLSLCRCDVCYASDEIRPSPPPLAASPPKPRRPLEEVQREANKLLQTASLATHPYLIRKGFPKRRGLVVGRHLIVPVRDRSGQLMGLHRIDPDGWKKFLPDTRADGALCILGHSAPGAGPLWFVEGLATGLSVLEAIPRTDRVAVCLGSDNLAKVASSIGTGKVVADHDRYKCVGCECRWDAAFGATSCPACGSGHILQPAGEKAARASGLPYWLSPEPGDANDYMLAKGLDSLRAALANINGVTY